MANLKYVKGDATDPQRIDDKPAIIPHITNDKGKWGRGFVVALSNKWDMPEAQYRKAKQMGMRLGETDFIHVEEDIVVANMCAQHDTGEGFLENITENDKWTGLLRRPIRYGYLSKCMSEVAAFCRADGEIWASIHAPRFGSALAGGHWPVIEALILELWIDKGIEVTIYDYDR